MKTFRWAMPLFLVLGAWGSVGAARAQDAQTTGTPTVHKTGKDASDPELEKLRLQKETLELEVEKLKLQATMTVQSGTEGKYSPRETKEEKNEKIDQFQADYSKKAEDLAKAHRDEEALLVLDLVNGEVWHHGTRYGINEWNALVEGRGWKVRKVLDGRDPSGHERNRYSFRNVYLLKYENRSRGVFDLKAGSSADDFNFLTPEGISLKSGQEDVRNAFQNAYFQYDKQYRSKNGVVLRYKHKVKWNFDDKMEIAFDRDGRMVEIRYGVLDER